MNFKKETLVNLIFLVVLAFLAILVGRVHGCEIWYSDSGRYYLYQDQINANDAVEFDIRFNTKEWRRVDEVYYVENDGFYAEKRIYGPPYRLHLYRSGRVGVHPVKVIIYYIGRRGREVEYAYLNVNFIQPNIQIIEHPRHRRHHQEEPRIYVYDPPRDTRYYVYDNQTWGSVACVGSILLVIGLIGLAIGH